MFNFNARIMEGWIKLYRQIQEDWIWEDPVKLKWWLDILLSVNHKDTKVNIGNEFYECKKGQSIKSLSTWASRWNTSKDTAKNFFRLLEKDGKILHENLQISTRITVCNYDSCEDDLHGCLTPSLRSPYDCLTQTETNNNVKNVKNEKNINTSAVGEKPRTSRKRTHQPLNTETVLDVKFGETLKVSEFLSYFNQNRGNMPQVIQISGAREEALKRILSLYTKKELFTVLKKSFASDFMQGKTTSWVADLNWILRPDRFLEILEGKYDNKQQIEKTEQKFADAPKSYGTYV